MARFHGPSLPAAAIANGEIANAMVAAGTLTGAKLASNPFVQKAVVGHNGAGACTATGLTVGQRVISVIGFKTDGTGTQVEAKASFEAAVTVADQLQQSSVSDLSTLTYIVTVIPAAS